MPSLQLLVTCCKTHTSLNEIKKLMTRIDNEAATNGATPAEHMSFAEANTCYFRGEKAIYAAVLDNPA